MRFYALRLHEAGMIKSSPQKIIAEGTDWRFFNEIKKATKMTDNLWNKNLYGKKLGHSYRKVHLEVKFLQQKI